MTEQANVQTSDIEDSAKSNDTVSKESVAKYLLAHPSFLIDNPDLLVQIQVQLQDNGVVSLTQIQAAQSRDKIKQLKSQLEGLVSNARKNELIYKTYAELNLDLAKATSIADLETSLQAHLVTTLGLESVRIVLLDNKDEAPLSEIQQRSLFDKKLAKQPFYFGRLANIEKEALFPKAKAESVALVRLNDNQETQGKSAPLGLLVISSKDSLHFQPDMDTVLVDYLRKNLNHHLGRLR